MVHQLSHHDAAANPPAEQTETPLEGPHYSYQLQYRKCGKPCKTCEHGRGHGPYWYQYWREGNRVRSKYLGKQVPAGLPTQPTALPAGPSLIPSQSATAPV